MIVPRTLYGVSRSRPRSLVTPTARRVTPPTPMNPTLFLFHISSISLATCFIPSIASQRRRSISTEAVIPQEQEEEEKEVLYPIQQPYPTRNQLFQLSRQLRRQINRHPIDAAFTLRQLHLVNERPRLHLPPEGSTSPSKSSLKGLLPERWIWRLPATAALHSIYRILQQSNPSSSSTIQQEQQTRIVESLVPIALIIARHALEFDTIMWSTILKAHGQTNAIEWERLSLRARGQAGGEGLQEETTIMTRLDHTVEREKRIELEEEGMVEGEKRHEDLVRRLWGEGFVREVEKKSTRTTPLSSRLRIRKRSMKEDGTLDDGRVPGGGDDIEEGTEGGRTLPRHLRSFSSIPTRTLDHLVTFLARNQSDKPEIVSDTLSISLSLSNLRVRRSSREALYHSFDLSLQNERVDLAARFFVDYVEHVERTGDTSERVVVAMFKQRLDKVLRPFDRSFDSTPSRETLSAVATLARHVDQQWTRTISSMSSSKSTLHSSPSPLVLQEIIRLLVAFPVAPYPRDVEPGTEEHRLARSHARVYKMVKHVLRRITESIIERTIHLGSTTSTLGSPPSSSQPTRRSKSRLRFPLSTITFNTLISYSLTKFQSPEIALLLLERMTRQGLSPTAATHNILFSIATDDRPRSYQSILFNDNQNRPASTDDRTIPTVVNHLTRHSNFDELSRIVFRILPELDQSSLPPSLLPPTPMNPKPPPREGRNPFLYTTLLYALACAGKVGLAERVWRNARWAAERSREEDEVDVNEKEEVKEDEGRSVKKKEKKGWVLPPHAFTIMLQMYAAEVRRGRQLERQLDPTIPYTSLPPPTTSSSTPRSRIHVRGWGRHALRVFLLRSNQQHQQQQSHPLSDLSQSPSTSSIPRNRHRFSQIPKFLRSEAAPIVALYELEGGSKEEELKSLELAMKDPRSRQALEVLFPGSEIGGNEGGVDGGGERRMKRRQKKDVRMERNAVRRDKDKIRAQELALYEQYRRQSL